MSLYHRKMLILTALGVLLLNSVTRPVTLSFALALLLASCAQNFVLRLHAIHVPRWLTALGLLSVVLIPLAIGIGWGCIVLLDKAKTLVEALVTQTENTAEMEEWFYQFITALPPQLQQLIQQMLEAVRREEILMKLLTTLGQWTSGYLAALPGKVAGIGLFLLFFLFCTAGYGEVLSLMRTILPADWYSALGRLRKAFSSGIILWVTAQLKLVGIVYLELFLGLLLLKNNHPILLAIVIALLDMVPLVGAGLVLLPWAVINLLLGRKLQAISLALLWLCVWGTRTALEPRFVGKKLQLPGAISLFSAMLGLSVWGFKGLILFPVTTAVIATLLKQSKGAAQ